MRTFGHVWMVWLGSIEEAIVALQAVLLISKKLTNANWRKIETQIIAIFNSFLWNWILLEV
jgi:hypothetical protein